MNVEIKVTRYNVGALLGWLAIVSGLVSAGIQYFHPNPIAYPLVAGGLIFGGIAVTRAGPVRIIVVKKTVQLKEHRDND